MKLFKHKRDVFNLLLVICAILSFYLGRILTFTFMQKVCLALILILFIIVFALVHEKTRIQKTFKVPDEQEQYISLKRTVAILEVIKYTLFFTIICCIIGYGLTRDYAFIFALIGAGLPYGILKIAYIISSFRYDGEPD